MKTFRKIGLMFGLCACCCAVLVFTSFAMDESPADATKEKADEAKTTSKPATVIDRTMPAIAGNWLIGTDGALGECKIVRSGENGADYVVYHTSSFNSAQPIHMWKWNSAKGAFEYEQKVSNDGKLPGSASMKVTVEDNGSTLRVKATLDEAGLKTLQSLKKDLDAETYQFVEESLDTKWTRRGSKPLGQGLASPTPPSTRIQPQANPLGGFGSGGFGGSVGTTGAVGGVPTAGTNNGGGFGGGVGGGSGGASGYPPGTFGGFTGDEVERYRDRLESDDLLLIESNEGLSAYSKSLGKWSPLKVGPLKNGKSRLSKSTTSAKFVSVLIDDQLYGYSSQAGGWDQISIPSEFQNKVKPVYGRNVLFVVIGDRTYALSAKTGKWTASDHASQITDPNVNDSSDESRPGILGLLTKAEPVDLEQLAKGIAGLEAEAAQLAKQIRQLKSENPNASADSPSIQKLRNSLEQNLSKTFDMKTQLEQSRVLDLQSRLSRLEQQLGRRQSQRTKIIDRRLHELIEADDTDWRPEPAIEGNAPPGQTGGGFF